MTTTKKSTTSPEVMDQLLADHFSAEAVRDMDGIIATLSDDCEHDVVGWPTGVSNGHDELKPFYERLFADFETGSVEPLRRYYGDDFCVDEVLWKGKAIGQPFGMPGDSRSVEFRILHVCEFADDKMTRENVWLDTATLFAQLSA